MKVCFFGLGSIGKKHLGNLIEYCQLNKFDLTVHAYRSSEGSSKIQGVDKEVYRIEDLDEDYDIAFITNPNSEHFNTIKLMKNRCNNMFIEKPIFDHINYDLESLSLEKGTYYVAAPLRYTGIVEKLKEILKEENIFSIRALCSSYLPEWRPNQDYRNVYSAKKELGGGVSIDLIHEWDYLIYLFGFPEEVLNIQGKYSQLEIDSEDLSIYIGKYKDKIIELHLDYFGRVARREVEIYTENAVIIGDFINKKITIRTKGESREINIKTENDMYKLEILNFMEMILKGKENINTIDHAYKVLKLIRESECLEKKN